MGEIKVLPLGYHNNLVLGETYGCQIKFNEKIIAQELGYYHNSGAGTVKIAIAEYPNGPILKEITIPSANINNGNYLYSEISNFTFLPNKSYWILIQAILINGSLSIGARYPGEPPNVILTDSNIECTIDKFEQAVWTKRNTNTDISQIKIPNANYNNYIWGFGIKYTQNQPPTKPTTTYEGAELSKVQATPTEVNSTEPTFVVNSTDPDGDDLQYKIKILTESGSEVYESGYVNKFNSLGNAGFSDGTTGWVATNSTNLVTNKILSNTGDGSAIFPLVDNSLGFNFVLNDKWFFYSKIRVTNTDSSLIAMQVRYTGGSILSKSQSNPTQNTFYELYGIATAITGTSAIIRLYHQYADSATANGKVMEIDGNAGVFAINMTALGIEDKTEAEMLELVRNAKPIKGGLITIPPSTLNAETKYKLQSFAKDSNGAETQSDDYWTYIQAVYNITLAEDVTINVGDEIVIASVYDPKCDGNSMELANVTEQYYHYTVDGLDSKTQKVTVEGRGSNLKYLAYAFK